MYTRIRNHAIHNTTQLAGCLAGMEGLIHTSDVTLKWFVFRAQTLIPPPPIHPIVRQDGGLL